MAAFDVFLSYAHADRERVLELRDALVAKGLEVWLDDTQIPRRGRRRRRMLLAAAESGE